MNTAIIGLGSNIDPHQNIQKARILLNRYFQVIKESPFIQTKAIGVKNQPDFVNGAVYLKTALPLEGLKEQLRLIEAELGRDPSVPKTDPRIIDLDIIAWNDKVIHPEFYTHAHVKDLALALVPHIFYAPKEQYQ